MKIKNAKNYFSAAEKEKIQALVKQAEQDTSGEIAIMVVEQSSSYREAKILGAILLSSLAALVLAVSIQHVTVWTYIPLVLLFYFPSYFCMQKFSVLKITLVGKKRLEEAVRKRAVLAFYEKGLYRTRDATGVLIFISIMAGAPNTGGSFAIA